METLLSHSFDNLTSPNPPKIRRGLRQLEGLLAQICLSRSSSPLAPSTPNKRHSMLVLPSKDQPTNNTTPPPSKKLPDLSSDPAFREFWKLQQSFQHNIPTRLLSTLEHLLGKPSSGPTDLLVLQTLDLLSGLLLLHPPSRSLFTQSTNMILLLDLLDPQASCPAIQASALLVLVTGLLGNSAAIRVFEEHEGLAVVTGLFKGRGVGREVKLRAVEVLYFYLMPEEPQHSKDKNESKSATNTAVLGGRGKEIAAAFDRNRRRESAAVVLIAEDSEETRRKDGGSGVRSQKEKQELLGRYLSNVQDLVDDLTEGSGPFGVEV